MRVLLLAAFVLVAQVASAQHIGFVVGATAPPRAEVGDFWSDTTANTLKRYTGVSWDVFGGGTAWGSITGSLISQTDLQTALDNRLLTNANAVSATKLLTARTINGTSFDGTANITLTGIPSFVVTTGDTTNATTAYANITGLSVAVSASTRYRLSCVIPYDANATTTGIGIGWTGPASPTLTRGLMVAPITTATPGSTVSVGNDTGAVTTGSVATTNNIATFEGIWSNGANAGTVQMRVKSEVAVTNAIIVRTGAMCSYAVY